MPRLLTALLAMFLLSSCQLFNKQKPYTGPWVKYTLEVSKAQLPAGQVERKQLLDEVSRVLEQRLTKGGLPLGEVKVDEANGTLQLTVGADTTADLAQVNHLLCRQGKMEWWPCYPAEDIIKQLAGISGGAQDGANAGLNRQLFTVLMPAVNSKGAVNPGAVVGYATARDTAAVLALLSDSLYNRVLPAVLKWAWAQKPSEGNQPLFELYAIQQSGHCIKNGDFAETKIEQDPNTSLPVLNITLNKDAAKRWEQMTATAAAATPQRGCIAILFCGQVLMAPTVQSKISGGKMQINGAGSLQDIKEMQAMMAAAELPVALTITAVEVTGAVKKNQ